MQEDQLYQRWWQWARAGRAFQAGGHRLRLLDSGRFSPGEGPDFRHACFELDGVRHTGAVEMHGTEAGWYRHGHHLDNRYADVALHVVAPGSACKGVRHEAHARLIPTVPLPPLPEAFGVACRAPDPLSALTGPALRRLAFRRLALRKALADHPPVTLFYEKLWRTLGYGGNAAAFEYIARRVPWSVLQALRHRPPQLQNHLEQALGSGPPLQTGGMRPASRPGRAVALWMVWFRAYGLPEFYNRVMALPRRRLAVRPLLKGLSAVFNPPGAATRLGRARLIEFLGNHLLPLELEHARETGSGGYEAYLYDLYLNLPLSQAYGVLNRPPFDAYRPLRFFYRAQALLHVRRLYCRPGLCAACPLGHRAVSQ